MSASLDSIYTLFLKATIVVALKKHGCFLLPTQLATSCENSDIHSPI